MDKERQPVKLTRRGVLKGATAVTVSFLLSLLTSSPEHTSAENLQSNPDTSSQPPEILYQVWKDHYKDYRYKADNGGDSWEITNEGDCEDFVFNLLTDSRLRQDYNFQLALIDYQTQASILGRSIISRNELHIGAFVYNKKTGDLFFVDNNALGGVVGPFRPEQGFDKFKSAVRQVVESIGGEKHGTPLKEKIQINTIQVMSIPSNFEEVGIQQIQKEMMEEGKGVQVYP